MNGHVFECAFEQGDKRQFAKTLEALEGYAKKTLKFSQDFESLFDTNPPNRSSRSLSIFPLSTPSLTR